jgi:hypothetical protein
MNNDEFRDKFRKFDDTNHIIDYMTRYTGGSIRHKGIRMVDIQQALFDLQHDGDDVAKHIFNKLCVNCSEDCMDKEFRKCKILFPMAYKIGMGIELKEYKGEYEIIDIEPENGEYKVKGLNKKCKFTVGFVKEDDIKYFYNKKE